MNMCFVDEIVSVGYSFHDAIRSFPARVSLFVSTRLLSPLVLVEFCFSNRYDDVRRVKLDCSPPRNTLPAFTRG